MRPEESIQVALFDYVKLQYPKVIGISESSGVRVSIGLAKKLVRMRTNHTHLDCYFLEPKGKYCGLVIELKAVKSIYKRNGDFISEHVEDQQKTIDLLNAKGYYATFACSLDEAIKVVDSYMNNEL